MSELRQNLVTREWVIITTDRAIPPEAYINPSDSETTQMIEPYDPKCPFCPGNEERDLEAESMPEQGPWETRVVNNKFPALSYRGELRRTFDGVHRWITGVGHHEIVVDHPQHNTTWALMMPDEVRCGLETFFRRGWSIRQDSRVEQIIYFKNHGRQAGASLKHPHSQIIALPIVPTNIRQRIENARRYFDDNGRCIFCTMLRDELDKEERLVVTSDYFVAFVVYAAASPFSIWILPRQHRVSYLYSQPDQLHDLAQVLNDILRRLYIGLRDPSYNLIIRSAPVNEIGNDYLHWYVAIVPRLSPTAGFELGTGMFINSVIPEACADFLRRIKV